jgi:hypothetical protein
MPKQAVLTTLALGVAQAGLAEMSPEPAYPLEHYGYALEMDRPEGEILLTGPGDLLWRLPPNPMRWDLVVNGPADHTGDDLPELILIEFTSRSFGVLHVLTLEPDRITTVMDGPGPLMEIGAYAALHPGQLLDEAFGTDMPAILDTPREDLVEEAVPGR